MILSPTSYRWLYPSSLLRVIDGDTIKVILDKGTDEYSHHIIRLAGINCPEMDTPEGKAAKERVIELVGNNVMIVQTVKDRTDPYHRYLGIVFVESFGGMGLLNLNRELLEEKHAVPYGPYAAAVAAMPVRQVIEEIKAIQQP